MNSLPSLIIQITVMLSIARIFGSFAKQLNQPSVLSEILGGIILGPTIFGTLSPALQLEIFPPSGGSYHLLSALAHLGLIAFVFIAGLEVDLDCIRGREKGAISTSISGIVIPFALGYALVILIPQFWRISIEESQLFALFIGTAMSISALPVIARILMDLDLMKSELGGIIMVAATKNDIFGWSIFALILTVLTASLVSQFLGGHGIVAAFLAGLILSERRSQKESILKKIYLSVMTILTPIYFVSIGLRTNFAADFDATIVLMIFTVALVVYPKIVYIL